MDLFSAIPVDTVYKQCSTLYQQYKLTAKNDINCSLFRNNKKKEEVLVFVQETVLQWKQA